MKTINRLGIAALKSIAAKPIATRDRTRDAQMPYSFPPFATTNAFNGSYSWAAPATGYWKFVAWGAGGWSGSGEGGGGSGAYGEITVFLQAGEVVTVTPGVSNVVPQALRDTTLTIRGVTYTAGGGAEIMAGTAFGPWDYSLNGSLGGLNSTGQNGAAGAGSGGGPGGIGSSGNRGGGAGAPARLPFRGGQGGGANSPRNAGTGGSPGAGGGWPNTVACAGGDGLVMAGFVRS